MRTQPIDNEHKYNTTNRLQPLSSNRFLSQNLISTQLGKGSNCYPVANTSDCVRQLPQNSVGLNFLYLFSVSCSMKSATSGVPRCETARFPGLRFLRIRENA